MTNEYLLNWKSKMGIEFTRSIKDCIDIAKQKADFLTYVSELGGSRWSHLQITSSPLADKARDDYIVLSGLVKEARDDYARLRIINKGEEE